MNWACRDHFGATAPGGVGVFLGRALRFGGNIVWLSASGADFGWFALRFGFLCVSISVSR